MTTFDLENPQPRPGDGLRDEAANLLGARYGRPTREKRADGKKTDLFFTRPDFGKPFTLFVEAKDLDRPLHRQDVVEIWADYSGIVRKRRPAALLLITRRGLSADAQAYVEDEQSEMRHQTIWELENEILGLTDYVRSLAGVFEQNGLSAYYIEGRARRAHYDAGHETRWLDTADGPLFDTVQAWIKDEEDFQPIAVLAGYGAGKSSFARRLISHQAQRALADPLARRPVLIPLGGFARYSDLAGLLGGMFTHDFPVDGFNVHRFLELNAKGRLLIVLDGFDEMKHAMSWADFRAQIQTLNRLTEGRAKVLLLGRPSAFTSTEEHVHVLRGLKRYGEGWRQLPDWPQFAEYELEPFSDDEREAFVRRYLKFRQTRPGAPPLDDAWIEARAKEVNALAAQDPEIFGKPVHAKILTDLAADPAVDLGRFQGRVSRWRLYETFFASLAEREVEKTARRPIGEADRLDFLREIAFWLWSRKGGATSFSALDVPDSLMERLAPGDAADLEGLKREYLTGAFLEKKSGDVFYFGHRSFAEFLVAQRMVLKAPGPAEHGVYSRLVRDGVRVFLEEAPDKAPIRAWADTLSTAQGALHLEYLEFLAAAFGGVRELAAALPTTSIWLPILEDFGDRLEFTPEAVARLWARLRAPENLLFFLVLTLLQLQAAAAGARAHDILVRLAAVLLDRVFESAKVDGATGKAPIEPGFEESRALAAAVLPGIATQFGDRTLVFRGERLAQQQAERLRLAGVELTAHPPAALLNLAVQANLDWSEVLAEMSSEGRSKAETYFRRTDTLRGVFVRSLAPQRRPIPAHEGRPWRR